MADHNIKLDPGAAALLDALHGAGYAAYAVGGCVRDSLLGLTPHDWDLCTSALPRQVLDRYLPALRRVARQHDGQTVAIFSHGAAMRIVL